MKLLVAGSRGLSAQADAVHCELDALHAVTAVTVLISGGAEGIDRLAEQWARLNGIAVQVFRPDYANAPGGRRRAAPLVRNQQMVDASEKVAVFWDGASRGTAYVVKQARKQRKLLFVHKLCVSA